MQSQKKVSKEELLKFAKARSWKEGMSSGGIDSFDNYIGEDLGNLVKVIGKTRDSDIMAQSNFDAALDMLGGESDDVEIHSFGHWGCGWIELILVNPQNIEKLTIAYEIHKLLEDYPLLDDADFSERQHEAFAEFAEDSKHELAKGLALHFGLPEEFAENKDLLDLAFLLNMECQHYYGDDSCLNIYHYREPDNYDFERLINILTSVYIMPGNNASYDYLCACLGIEK